VGETQLVEDNNELEFFEFTDEAVAGSKVIRDGLTSAMAEMHKHPRGVFIVESISRLGRTVSYALTSSTR